MAMIKFRAPPLPIAGGDYKQDYFAQLIRALTLYFNQLDSKTPVQWESVTADRFLGGAFIGRGQGIEMPHLSVIDAADQYASASDTPAVVAWSAVTSLDGFELNANDSLTAQLGAVYKIDYSLQFVNTDSAAHDAFVWIEVDGVPVPESSSAFTLPARKSAGNPSALVGYSHLTLPLDAGQSVKLMWATTQAATVSPAADGVYIKNIASISSPYLRPGNPSSVASIIFVSALPTPTVTGVSAAGATNAVTVITS